MKTKLALLVSLLALSACDSQVAGKLNMKSELKVASTDGKNYGLVPGRYDAAITLRDRQNAIVSIRTAIGTAAFEVPGTQGVDPNYEGPVQVSARELGQEFSLSGNVSRQQLSFERVVREQCLYTVERRMECGIDQWGRQVCFWREYPVYGRQLVRERGVTDAKVLKFNFVKGNAAAGSFNGSYRLRDYIQSRQPEGFCELR